MNMLRSFEKPVSLSTCLFCRNLIAKQIRPASQLSSINRGLFKEGASSKRTRQFDAPWKSRGSRANDGSPKPVYDKRARPDPPKDELSVLDREHVDRRYGKGREASENAVRRQPREGGDKGYRKGLNATEVTRTWGPRSYGEKDHGKGRTDSQVAGRGQARDHGGNRYGKVLIATDLPRRTGPPSSSPVDLDPLISLKDRITEAHLLVKKLAAEFEKDVPDMLEPSGGFGDHNDPEFRSKVVTYWKSFFANKPGRMGVIIDLYVKNVKEIRSLLSAPPLSGSKEPWVKRRKVTYLGREVDKDVYPVRTMWIRRHINTGYQRSLSKRTLRTSNWKGGVPATIEDYENGWVGNVATYEKTGDARDWILRQAVKADIPLHRRKATPLAEDNDLGFLSDLESEGLQAEDLGDEVLQHQEVEPVANASPKATRQPDMKASLAKIESSGSLPLSTAASTFLYGKSAALACLKAGRRIVYRAYLDREVYNDSRPKTVPALLQQQSCQAFLMDSLPLQDAMDRASRGRPHQGVVLEVSPIPFPPVKYMRPVPRGGGAPHHSHVVEPQGPEEAAVNNRQGYLTYVRDWRKPLIVLLDGIKDEGNMGNIIRTAYFHGVDAVAICANTCAPINSSVVAKAASGALEAMPLLRLNKPTEFVTESRIRNWKIWASVPPGTPPPPFKKPTAHGKGERPRPQAQVLGTSNMRTPLTDVPVILMLGAEGEGLRDIMLAKADGLVSIDPPVSPQQRELDVDSLNVASAAAILIDAFMRQPPNATPASPVVKKRAEKRSEDKKDGKAAGQEVDGEATGQAQDEAIRETHEEEGEPKHNIVDRIV